MVRVHPPVLKLRWAEKLGLPDCPYVIRWRLEVRGLGSVRVHHWLSSDDPRAYHDHPWWFLTLVVKGGYTDSNPRRDDHLQAPRCPVPFRAAPAHRVSRRWRSLDDPADWPPSTSMGVLARPGQVCQGK